MATAFAVLAVYLLVLLAPLHQAAGLQRDLNALGYAALDTWSICTPLAQQDEGEQPRVVKCAAAGIGKNQLAAVTPAIIATGIVRVATIVHYAALPPSASSVIRVTRAYRAHLQHWSESIRAALLRNQTFALWRS